MVDVDVHGKRFINIYLPSLDGCHLTNDIFKVEMIYFQLKCNWVPPGPIGNTSALVQVMTSQPSHDAVITSLMR